MGVSKVNYGSKTLIDLTGDTVTANKLLSGYKAHDKSGNAITGTCTYDCDSSDATAGVYDIYHDKTAYVNGSKVTGAYACVKKQLKSSSSGCSTSQLVMGCPFKPRFIMVQFNSDKYKENMVICCWGASNAIVYHSYGSISVVYNKIELDRTQITSNVSNYWHYSNGNIYVNRPNSTYSWADKYYWVFAFK